MEENILGITRLVNAAFGKIALALLSALHIQPSNPQYPIPNHIAMEFLVFGVAVVFFLWLKSRLSIENPGGTQQVMEALLRNNMSLGVADLLENNVGHNSLKYLPMIGSIGLFVLFANLISVVPGLASPTAQVSVPLGCAVVVFLYYHWAGLVKHGPLHYGKHFMGPNLALSPLMVVVESVSHLARLLSLTVRLWVNMMVSEMLYVIFLGLTLALLLFAGKASAAGYVLAPIPFLAPVIFIILHIFVAFVQAFVFTILPVIYLAGAVSEAH
ncbi:MAG TPA: F0F1 ATP synthase subunit A [Candidatus Acidoferrales bacterium]|jgi:F-type H+-transporting ATPase subunit a|nr:F0F1 ATP synthase subunit A [Candidatus Acidoferrales bacterium]